MNLILIEPDHCIRAAIQELALDRQWSFTPFATKSEAVPYLHRCDPGRVVLFDYVPISSQASSMLPDLLCDSVLLHRHAYILMTTLFPLPTDVRAFLRSLHIGELHKPFDIDELEQLVTTYAASKVLWG
jgi:DNA-binding NtrC family response regulator